MRWVASLELGVSSHATRIGSSGGRNGSGAAANHASAPHWRAAVNAAATWQCGKLAFDHELFGTGYLHASAQQHLQAFDHLRGQAFQTKESARSEFPAER